MSQGTRLDFAWTLLCLLVAPVVVAEQGRIAHVPAAASSRFFTTSDGIRLHYLEAGQGKTLVFIPGWSMPGDIWAPQMAGLSDRYRVVLFDPRAQGKSEIALDGYTAERRAQDIKELLDQISAEPVVLVGWSLGVLESLAYVRTHGESRLAGLVLVDNSVGEDPAPASRSGLGRQLRRDRRAALERFARGMFRSPQSREYLNGLVDAAMRMPFKAGMSLLSYPFPRQYWREAVHSMSKPVLYVVTPRFEEQARNLKTHRPGTWTQVFEQAGHALFVDEAERFNHLLDDFLVEAVWANQQAGQ